MESNISNPIPTKNNPVKIDHYLMTKILGKGSSSIVKYARHEITGTEVAIKIINKKRMKQEKMNKKIKREIRLLRYFNHPNIIKLYEVLDTTTDIFVIMEYVAKGELFELIAQRGKLPENEVRFFFQQIIEGVEYCHQHLVSHRDLKPENILIDESNIVKIADFGLSNLMKDGKYLKTACGSPNYAAPEVLMGSNYCGTEVDTWSCGVVLFALLAGFLPFDEEIVSALYKKIKEAVYTFPKGISALAKDLIIRIFQPNPALRIKFHEIKMHPWLRESIPRGIEIFIKNNIQSHNKLEEEVFDKLTKLNLDFHNLSSEKIKEAIKKKKDYTFVIAYNLLHNDFLKTQVANSIANPVGHSFVPSSKGKNPKEEYVFKNIHNFIQQTVDENPDYIDLDISNPSIIHKSKWIYGVLFEVPAKILMKGVYECLNSHNIAITVKSADYKIKCHYKDYGVFNNNLLSPNLQNEQEYFEEENFRNILNNQKDTKPTSTKMINTKIPKFSKNEFVFRIQIYAVPDKKSNSLNIQLSRGHPIKFMEFVSIFIKSLQSYFKNNPELVSQSNFLNEKSQSRENRVYSYNSNPNTFIQMPTQSLNLPNNNNNHIHYLNGSRIM